ncbi:MAG: hypothetical protein KF851_08705 [Pirellulaceae bacterium]|nr:hypothetical protein [Pirellulaceae bacterium]
MEFSVHRQLKEQYCGEGCELEVPLGRYRIDVVDQGRLIEIQHSPLASIRQKIAHLVKDHQVDIVKPIVARKQIVRLHQQGGEVASVRWSPQRRTMLAIFDELLHFTEVFPHPNLRIIAPLIEVQEIRYPGHGRRRRWRVDDFVVADRLLERVIETMEFAGSHDLRRLLPSDLPKKFDTEALANLLQVNRSVGQRIAYVLRQTGEAKQIGKSGNRLIYQLQSRPARVRRRA